ncbi:hypothetical protein BN982_03528 [Halobacillus karajensis]|uniref:Uncharacterized protein n=1 Tax=Halobacillus karajensis TaxID=195088 RepID=A0A059NXY7_9BACI|nr:hypothetical protein BN982_03528 [Halobacillus karajensis]CDQ24773.1 hypothetical protein BN983_03070 [Halobacillus karajensis]CDQ28867.1 hypothetical protein BN981_03184 [Halobacillus karajensis]
MDENISSVFLCSTLGFKFSYMLFGRLFNTEWPLHHVGRKASGILPTLQTLLNVRETPDISDLSVEDRGTSMNGGDNVDNIRGML